MAEKKKGINSKRKIILLGISVILLIAISIVYSLIGYKFFMRGAFIAETNKNIAERGHLISETHVTTLTKDQVNDFLPEQNKLEGNISDVPKYDIDLYKIVYTSDYNGKVVNLSGMIMIPKRADKITQLQYHHGSLYPYPAESGWGSEDAPSLYDGKAPHAPKSNYETRMYGNMLASNGYLVSMPDYAGYGIASNLEHPYSVNPELAKESVDMILATREFAKKHSIDLNEKVGLYGWSEGGAVSTATQKLIESKYNDKIKVLANAEMSGPLRVADTFKYALIFMPLLSEEMNTESLDYLAWVYYAYNKFSNHPVANELIFDIPVKNDLDVLNKRKTNITKEVFKNLDKETYQHMLNQALKSDLVVGWKPKAPIFVHHGDNDELVPYDNNAEVAVNTYNKNGGKATLVKYPGHTHISLGALYIKNIIDEFNSLESK
ncbi:alpha/beta hydrolase family protein [Neisseria montereyensis]|uniref:Lipase family protein n=1 Tax=Neisseria montereyensis TaxID=2973938 RepID=A0ABT2FBN7_9NEIS|nr:lipase family protein [Neisseria montereyensis]MCS4533631.1 lipase family protein [Neisseria montereyensis]